MEEKDEIVISLSDVWNIIKKNAAFIIQDILFQSHTRLQFSYMLIRQMIMKIKTTSIYFLSKPMHRILLLHILKC